MLRYWITGSFLYAPLWNFWIDDTFFFQIYIFMLIFIRVLFNRSGGYCVSSLLHLPGSDHYKFDSC